MTAKWYYDENTQVGIDYNDVREVEMYDDRMQQLRDFKKEVDELAADLDMKPDSLFWEIGTGTAEMALGMALLCKHVYATDISQTMIDYSVRKAERRKIENIQFDIGGYLSGFLPQEPIDAALGQLSLHHLPDFWKLLGLQRVYNCLKPGGIFVLKDLVYPSDIDDYSAYFDELLANIASKAGDGMAQDTANHIKKEFSTFEWVMEGILERVGFTIEKKENQGILTKYICVKQ
jgi:putative AdoMet-dependent methyltransferase